MCIRDRDYTLQKAVELGVAAIQPLFTERGGVDLNGERLQRKIEPVSYTHLDVYKRQTVGCATRLKCDYHPASGHGLLEPFLRVAL